MSKERYELRIYAGCECYSITDTKEKQPLTIENAINLLNKQDQQISQLKEEVETLKNMRKFENKNGHDRFMSLFNNSADSMRDLKQQLAEKDAEIEGLNQKYNKISNKNSYLSKKIREQENYNISLSTKWYKAQQELKTNTHQVCEKIRKRLPRYIYSFQEPDVPRTKVIEYADIEYILDQLENTEGEK